MTTLPFKEHASVTAASSDVLGTIALSTWRQPEPRQTPTGETWDWSGEAEIAAAALLVDVDGNRRLYVVDAASELPDDGHEGTPPGRRLQVVSAVRHDFLPHVELRLAVPRGSGN